MFKKFQKFVRGFFFDPDLEKKAHDIADETHETLRQTRKILNNVENAQQLFVLAGIGLLVFGFIAGLFAAKEKEERKSA